MRHALEEAHGGIYRYTSKREMDRVFDRAYRRIDHAMTDLEFWRLAAPVVDRIKCGHTGLWYPQRLQKELGATLPLLPLEVRDFANRVYVYRDYSNPGSALEGCELLSINGLLVSRFLERVSGIFAGDGNTTTAKAWFMGFGRVFGMQLYAQGIESPFRVIYHDKEGKRQTVELAGMTGPAWGKTWKAHYAQPDPPNADLRFLDEGKIAVLIVRHWFEYADEQRKLKFSDFLKASFAQIHEKGSSNLIVDIRNNLGGLDAPVYELFEFLWNKPFRYYEDIISSATEFDFFKYDPDAYPISATDVERRADGKFHFVKHSGLDLYQPQQPQFTGRVFVIMNGGSFSSSAEFLSLLHFYKRAKFIGEESAGGYYGSTSGRFVQPILPNSKAVLSFGLLTFYQAVNGYKHPDRGVLPDYPVAHTISDMLAGRDRDMELALSLARMK